MTTPNLVNNERGGVFQTLILIAILVGGGYYALKYFGFLGPISADTAAVTLNGGKPIAASPAGQAVQGAEAAGEVMGSGR